MNDPVPTVTGDFAASVPARDELLKVLLDEERLAILGLAVRGDYTVDELTAALSSKRSAVARQVAQLLAAGLLRRGDDERVGLDVAQVQALKRALFARPAAPKPETTDAQILATFVRDGKMTQLPAQQRKRVVVLAWLARQFETGRNYREAEVNDLLRGHSADHATLRRYLVDMGYLVRAGGVYRRGALPGEERA